MKWCLCVLVLCSGVQSFADEGPWAESFTAARQQAEAERKLILLHFHSDACPPCARVESEVFPDPEVLATLSKNYVPLKVHVKQQPTLAQRYNVNRWPTDVIVSSSGQEIARTISPQSPQKYCQMLNQVASQAGVGLGQVATAGGAVASPGAGNLPAPQASTGVSPAGWNDQPVASPQSPPDQPLANAAGMIVNPWVNQANQAANSAGQAAQSWSNYAQQQTTQANQMVQQQVAGAQQQASQFQATAQQQANQLQAGLQQRASQYQAAAQDTANQYQTAAQQQVNQWQEQAAQVEQRANQYQAAGAQAVDDYAAAANKAAEGYRVAAEQQAEQAAAATQQQVETYSRSANAAVDYIAQAATIPSQLPSRRSTYGGSELVTNVAPQPGRAMEGTTEVPRPETIRTGDPTRAAEGPYQPISPSDPRFAPALPQDAAQAQTSRGSGYQSAQDPTATNRPRVTPGPFSNYPGNRVASAPANNAPAAAAPMINPQPSGNTQWNVPPTNNAPTEPATARTEVPRWEVPSWQPNPAATQPAANTMPEASVAASAGAPPSKPDVPPQAPPAQSAPPAVAQNNAPPVAPANVDNVAPAAPPAHSAPTQPVAAAQQFAMDGFCPVTLIETRKWQPADPRFGAVHRGQTYIFASAAEQKRFLADPDRYAPVLACHDPVEFSDNGKMVTGNKDLGIIYKDRIYLFSTEASLDTFSKAPDRYAGTVYQAMLETDRNTQRR